MTTTRCDLHLHSSASAETEEWYSRHFGCPESYASPAAQYERCIARGMSLVTLTDHDTIAGGLTLLERPGFFLSEEITTRFPASGAVVHVLAWNITPAQHDRLQAARDDIYQLVDVLRREAISHGCAHPLVSPNTQFSVDVLEQILVLFPTVEVTNGLTDRRLDAPLRGLLDGLEPQALAAMARRHGLAHLGPPRCPKAVSAGSDDHARRASATVYTEVDGGALDPAGFLAGVMAGSGRPIGHPADLATMQVTVSNTTYHFLDDRRAQTPGYHDPFLDLVDVVNGGPRGAGAACELRGGFVANLVAGAARHIRPLTLVAPEPEQPPFLQSDDRKAMADLARCHDALIAGGLDELVAGVIDIDMYRMLGGVRDVIGAVCAALPALFAADHFARQHSQATAVLAAWQASPRVAPAARLALFSDSVDHVDGVTRSLRGFAARAAAGGCDVRIPYCGGRPGHVEADDPRYAPLEQVAEYRTELYDGLPFHVPSLLGTVDWLWRHQITHVDLATPGPMGAVGLIAARILRLPVTASYHTAVPELIARLAAPPLARVATTLVGWFYRNVDRVFAFSACSRQRLVELGVEPTAIELVPVAIDPDQFAPTRARPGVFAELGIATGGRPVVLSVGRLSREKNLPRVIDAVTRLQDRLTPPPILVIVGDGPERVELTRACQGLPFVHFVGVQEGDVLGALYASADVFAFASDIDTLGLVNLEAMASGLPVVVPRDAAIADLVGEARAGLCYPPGPDGLAAALAELLRARGRCDEMATRARQVMLDRWRSVDLHGAGGYARGAARAS